MKQVLQTLIETSLDRAGLKSDLDATDLARIQLDRTKDPKHGDFACNAAMIFSKKLKKSPRDIAQAIQANLPEHTAVAKVEIAGPGFINFYLNQDAKLDVVKNILAQGENFGRSKLGEGKRVIVEFVSSNPTGPLHVGHGRGAAFGSALASLLRFAGFEVHGEYYVNDAGRQMDILAASVWLRYLINHHGLKFEFPSNGYKGDYVADIAKELSESVKDQYASGDNFNVEKISEAFSSLPADEPQGGDKEQHIDAIIQVGRETLGRRGFREVLDFTLDRILADIRADLHDFGVNFENWYSERSLFNEEGLLEGSVIEDAIQRLKEKGHTYEKDGALWFRATNFGDEKDRVLLRANGVSTYFASDVAYHMNKYDRGFDEVVDILGADHHGYVPRLKAVLTALDFDASKFTVPLVQFAILYRGKEKVQMSTRSGQYVTLRELREEVGKDACRFFYVHRRPEQHMDFDLELAKSQTNDNPVYYIQYAHARIASVFRQLDEKGFSFDETQINFDLLDKLTEPQELALLDHLAKFPELIEVAATHKEPHQLTHYLHELASHFHSYYNAHAFLVEDAALREARLSLVLATRQVLQNGLNLLGLSAPEAM